MCDPKSPSQCRISSQMAKIQRDHMGVVVGGDRLQDPSDVAKGEAESRSKRLVVVVLEFKIRSMEKDVGASRDTTAPPSAA